MVETPVSMEVNLGGIHMKNPVNTAAGTFVPRLLHRSKVRM